MVTDPVVWRWDRTRMRWWTLLDGFELRAEHQRFSRQSRWWPVVIVPPRKGRASWRGSDHFATPDEAQAAAFARWKRMRR